MNDKKYAEYLESQGLYNFRDKKRSVTDHMGYMLLRTQSAFTWHNLPDTIPQEYLETYIQCFGYCGIIKAGDELYAVQGGLGGEPDAYYQPTLFTCANPYLQSKGLIKGSGNYEIGVECVVVKNDRFYKGLTPLFNRYASQLAENELSMNMASINGRMQQALVANDDTTKEACDKYIEDIIGGKLTSILDDSFMEENTRSIPMSNTSQSGVLGDLIEYEQYLKASWYNEVGLNANYNMKREALNSAESSINDDILFPLIDEMLMERRNAAEEINTLFGTDISVDLASSWKDNKEEEQITLEEDSEETSEEETETAEEETETEEEETKTAEDIEEIKEDIEEIKEEMKEGEGDEQNNDD